MCTQYCVHIYESVTNKFINALLFQALIYPLTVATKSQSATRKEAAEMILKNMREHSSALVQQAIMVSEELIRVAILWHEQWHEGLEDASRLAGCTNVLYVIGQICGGESVIQVYIYACTLHEVESYLIESWSIASYPNSN